ncbi:MAG: hypothetical protein R3B84_21855 [Zavarzinella sp.]
MKLWKAGVAGVLAVALVAVTTADEALKIKDVMKAAYGKGGLKTTVGKELKAKSPDWDAVATQAKTWVSASESLGKNTPPKGTAESWKEKCEAYVKAAKDLEAAAGKKDLKAANAAFAVLTNGKTCGGCHGSHK